MNNKKYRFSKETTTVDKKALAEKMERMAHDIRAGRDPFQEACKEATHELSEKCVRACHEVAAGDDRVLLAIMPNVLASMVVSVFVSAAPTLSKADYIEAMNMCFKESANVILNSIDPMLKDVRKAYKEEGSAG